MKTAEAKPTAKQAAKTEQPFFSKGGHGMLSNASVNEHGSFISAKRNPFFTGNQPIQAKLNIGSPNDKYEKEADHVADKVVQRLSKNETTPSPINTGAQTKTVQPKSIAPVASITPMVQAKCASCDQEEKLQKKEEEKETEAMHGKLQKKPIFDSNAEPPPDDAKNVQRKCTECEKEEKHQKKESDKAAGIVNQQIQLKPIIESNARSEEQVQRKCANCEEEEHVQKQESSSSAQTATPSVESSLSAAKGSGCPLPESTRTQMESSIGADFAQVRVHNDSSAVQMSKDLHAQAFTHGTDIYFNSGKYNTNSNEGKHLLAHELTHTIQQGGVQTKNIQPGKSVSKEKNDHLANIIHTKPSGIKNTGHSFVEPQATVNTQSPIIQQKEEEDGLVVSALKEGVWTLLKSASPEVYDIFRYKGFVNWANEKISSFVSDTVNSLTAPIKVGSGVIEQVKANFDEFKVWLASAAERLKQGDCTPFIEASDFIKNILEGITGPALEALKAFLAPIKEFVDKMWNDVGKPLWDFVSKIFGAIWDAIKWVADKVWTHIKSIINVYAEAWQWFAHAIGFEGDDKDSLWEQVKKKVSDLWEAFKKKLEPYKTHLMVLGGIILLLSPAGPFILGAAAITGIMYAASKIRHYLQDKEAIINERGFIKGVLVPEFFNAMKTVGGFLKSKAAAVSGALKSAVSALHGLSKDIGESALAALNAIIDWLSEKFDSLEEWGELQLTKLINNLQDIFARIAKFLEPVTEILGKVGEAIADYYKLPFLVLNTLFYKIPKCIRDKIIAFLTKYVFKHIPILKEIKDVQATWTKMEKKVMQIIDMLFVHGQLLKALWEIFNVLLDALKFPKELAVKVYNKAFDVFDKIVEKPKIFFVNMLKTVKLGITGFFERKWIHLKNGFNKWLFSAVNQAGGGIYIPKAFSFSEIFKMIASLFDIGMEKVYKSIAKKRGQDTADKVRKWVNRISKGAATAWKWLKSLQENSLDDTIEMIMDKGAELLDIAIDAVIDWIVTKVIEKVSAKIVTMLDPTGIMTVVNSLIAFYNAVETAIEKAREILEFVDGVLDNITEVLAGSFVQAAKKLEDNLEKAIPLFLEFLANQLSLGKLGKKIKEMATKAEKWIDDKIDWLVDKALAGADWLIETGKSAVDAFLGWWKTSKSFTAQDGSDHNLFFTGEEGEAQLMLASKKATSFAAFIGNVVVSKDSKKADAQKAAIPIAKEIDDMKKQFPPKNDLNDPVKKKKYDDRKNKLAGLMSELSIHVAVLMDEKKLHDGSSNDPIPIRWAKRGHVLEIVDLIPKDSLWKSKGMTPPDPIESASMTQKTKLEIPPTKRIKYKEQEKDKTYIVIGVDSSNIVEKGSVLKRNKTDGVSEKNRFRQLLVNNYYVDLNSYDIDHVKDLGFEGKDKVSNLWPLHNEINQRWANFVYKQVVAYKDKDGKPQVGTPGDLYGKCFVIEEIGDF